MANTLAREHLRCNHHYMTTDRHDQVSEWLRGRLPEDWFTSLTVTVDREETFIVGTIPPPEGVTPESARGRITRFREATRTARIEIARELEDATGRKVSWGVTCADETVLFTRLAVPVMTRLAQPERHVLDTLVAAGVAKSRSEALAWCVRLVRANEGEWLDALHDSLAAVRQVRAEGPQPA